MDKSTEKQDTYIIKTHRRKAYLRALTADNTYGCLFDFQQYLLSLEKHRDLTADQFTLLDEIQSMFHEYLADNEVRMDLYL